MMRTTALVIVAVIASTVLNLTTPSPARADTRVAAGKVEKVDAERRRLMVEVKGEKLVLELTERATITLQGKSAELAELDVPFAATITYDADTLRATKLSVVPPRAPVKEEPASPPVELCKFSVLAARWENSYEYTFQEVIPAKPNELAPTFRDKTVRETPKRPGEKLLVVTVRCEVQRRLTVAERQKVKKSKTMIAAFNADAAIFPSSWYLGPFDEAKNSLQLHEALASRVVGGDAQVATKYSVDKRLPETMIFLSPNKSADCEVVWSVPQAMQSLVLVVMPQPKDIAESSAQTLTFDESHKFRAASPFINVNAAKSKALPAKE